MREEKYVIGADLGGTTCKLGIFTADGEVQEKWQVKTNPADNGSWILPDIADAVDKKLEALGIAKADVKGLGIGTPGAVLADGVVNRAVNLGWGVVPVAEELGKLTGLPVKVGNDANVAALGEYWKGGGEGLSSIVMVTLGTGIGGGIIINGKILTGYNGAGGEIGHIVVNPDEPEACGCGNHGCIEQYASATGIVRLAKQELESSKAESILRADKGQLTAKDVFDAAKKGDALALNVTTKVGNYLGHTLAVIANVINPEAFILGGGVSKAGPILLDETHAVFERDAFHAVKNTKILLAKLGNDAGIYGAAKMIIG